MDLKNLNILVTGGAGYIGSILVPKLLNLGSKVTVLDNFLFNQQSLMFCFKNKNFNIIKGDCRDRKILNSIVKDFDLIIPLAALVGMPSCNINPQDAKSINTNSIKNLTQILSKNQLMIIPNTNSGYGIGKDDMQCDENSDLRPLSLYGKTKVEAEKIAMNRNNSCSLRLATVFGVSPRMRMDLLVNDFVWRAFKDKVVVLFEAHFMRNFIHIDDVADTFIFIIKNWNKSKNQIFNVGLSKANLSKKDLCQIIKKYLNNFVFLESELAKDEDKRNYIVSNKKLERLGWNPKKTISDGIEELLKFYSTIPQVPLGNV